VAASPEAVEHEKKLAQRREAAQEKLWKENCSGRFPGIAKPSGAVTAGTSVVLFFPPYHTGKCSRALRALR
jgi:hypothetical protein